MKNLNLILSIGIFNSCMFDTTKKPLEKSTYELF